MTTNIDNQEFKKLLKEQLNASEYQQVIEQLQKFKNKVISKEEYLDFLKKNYRIAQLRKSQNSQNNQQINNTQYHGGQNIIQQLPSNINQNAPLNHHSIQQSMQRTIPIPMNSSPQPTNNTGVLMQNTPLYAQGVIPNVQTGTRNTHNGRVIGHMQSILPNMNQYEAGGVRILAMNPSTHQQMNHSGNIGGNVRGQNYIFQGSFALQNGFNDNSNTQSNISSTSNINRRVQQGGISTANDNKSQISKDTLLLRTIRDPSKIKPEYLRNAIRSMKKNPEKRREFLEKYPWVGIYLKRLKIQRTREGYQPSESRRTITKTTDVKSAADMSLLAKAQLQNKLNLIVESRGYSGCTPEVITKVTDIVTNKVNDLLKELRETSLYKGDEHLSIYKTQNYFRNKVNEGHSFSSRFSRNEIFNSGSINIPSLESKQSINGEDHALSFLENVTNKRRKNDQNSDNIELEQFKEGRQQSGKRIGFSNSEYPPRTITPIDFKTVFESDPFFRQSRTLDSLLHFHLQ